MSPGNGNIYEFGDFRLIPDEGLLLRHGEPVPLTLKAFATLTLLVDRHGHLVSKSELLEAVWEGSFVEEGAVSRSVHTIRNALGEEPKSNRFIQTVPRRGYRFVAPVRRINGHSGAFRLHSENGGVEFDRAGPDPGAEAVNGSPLKVIASEELPVPPECDENSLPRRPGSAVRSRSLALLAAGILLVGVLAAGIYVVRIGRGVPPVVESLAVYPFRNLTGQEDDAYIADGLTDHLINSLSNIPGLYVAASDSSFAARDRSLAPQEVSRELRVGHVLSGNVQRDGEFLRVSLRIIEGETGKVVWTDSAFRPASEIFALQDDIARLSTQAITGSLKAAEVLGDYGTADREAYLHYLKGRHLWHKQTEADTIKAISEFERSIARDPNFALAYCGLADSYTNLALTFRPPNEAMPKAAEYAAKALAIDPELPEALFSEASVNLWYRRDVSAAERSILRALELRPNHSLAHDLYGIILMIKGRIDDGLAEIERAVELDPLAHYQSCDLAWQYYHGGRFADSAALARTNLEKTEACPFERLFLGQSLSAMGRHDEGLGELAKIEAYAEDWHPSIAERARIHAVKGEKERALKLLSDLEARIGGQYVDPYSFAVIYSGLRDADKTLYWLNAAVEANSYNLVFLGRDPRFNEIKADQRFIAVLRRARLPVLESIP